MRPPAITPPTARVGDAPRSSPPPGSSPGDFAALLDQTTARTAPAEGPTKRPARAELPSRRDDGTGTEPVAAAAAATATDPAEAATAAAVPPQQAPASERPDDAATPTGAAPAADPSDPDAPPTLYTAVDPTALGAAGAAPALPLVAAPATAAAAVGTPALPATPAPPTTPTTPGVPGAPVLPVDPAAVAAVPVDGEPTDPAAPVPAGGLVIPAALLGTKTDADAKGQDREGRPQPAADAASLLKGTAAADPAATTATTATAATTAPATPAAPAPPATPDAAAAPAATAAPPTTPVAGQPAATATTAVPMAAAAPQLTRASVDAAVERVHDLVRIATTRAGGARATLQLKPVELGPVDVHLRTTREGLVATIAAHDQAGLDALQQAGAELRRSLEDRGVVLHRLDLQLGAGQNGFGNGADARQTSAETNPRRFGASAPIGAEDEAPHDLTISTVTSTPAGVLVDVQA